MGWPIIRKNAHNLVLLVLLDLLDLLDLRLGPFLPLLDRLIQVLHWQSACSGELARFSRALASCAVAMPQTPNRRQ